MFELDERLKADTVLVGEFELSLLLLNKDANYPWCILVPKVPGVTEIFHLEQRQQLRLMSESMRLAKVMSDCFSADKMNVAAIGNVVSQLHIHHVARFKNDASWPKPVWGAVPSIAYSAEQLASTLGRLHSFLQGDDFDVA